MNERVAAILAYHATTSFGSRENLVRQEDRVADLYRSLDRDEAAGLARLVVESADPTATAETDMILLCLACLRPGSLDGFHEALIDRGVLYPPVIFHRAGPDTAERLLSLLPGEQLNLLLCALAWVGGEDVEAAFRTWRERPPSWVDRLHVPPGRYANQAGWELDGASRRRDLTSPTCRPLVPPGDVATPVPGVRVVADHEGTCGWCGRTLTTLLDVAGGDPSFTSLFRGRLRVATCEVCTCFGTVYTRVGADGASAWHESNVRPDHLPDPDEEWEKLPRNGLVLGPQPRNPIESADWLVPGVSFSQLGGHPTWVQDAAYPECPGCRRAMPFIGQVSVEDCVEFGEGIYYLFACERCGVAATSYQQS